MDENQRAKFLYLVDRYNALFKEYVILMLDYKDFPATIEYGGDCLDEIESFILDYADRWNTNLESLESMIISVENYILKFKQRRRE